MTSQILRDNIRKSYIEKEKRLRIAWVQAKRSTKEHCVQDDVVDSQVVYHPRSLSIEPFGLDVRYHAGSQRKAEHTTFDRLDRNSSEREAPITLTLEMSGGTGERYNS